MKVILLIAVLSFTYNVSLSQIKISPKIREIHSQLKFVEINVGNLKKSIVIVESPMMIIGGLKCICLSLLEKKVLTIWSKQNYLRIEEVLRHF
jgi:hypothetical protein